MNVRSQRARIIIGVLLVLVLISMLLSSVVAGASTRGEFAQTPITAPSTDEGSASLPGSGQVSAASGYELAASAEVGDTTTTQPEDHRVFGKSLTRPNEGMEPQDAGDPGGWLQSSLFFIVCGAVILLALGVSYQSRKIRDRRKAAGLDPVDLARARGEGVRAPSPLDRTRTETKS